MTSRNDDEMYGSSLNFLHKAVLSYCKSLLNVLQNEICKIMMHCSPKKSTKMDLPQCLLKGTFKNLISDKLYIVQRRFEKIGSKTSEKSLLEKKRPTKIIA